MSEKRSTFKGHIFRIYAPKPANVIYDNINNVEMGCLCSISTDDSTYLLWSLYGSGDDAADQTSSTRIVQHKQYVCCALLFLRESPTDWSNLYTAVKTIVCSFPTL